MKKYFILLLIFICALSFGQRTKIKTIATTGAYTLVCSADLGDTINKNATKSYTYWAPTLFATAQAQVSTDTVTGKPKTRLYIYYSFDNSNWVYADSATTLTGGSTGRTTKTTVYAPYIQFRIKAVDSTQKTVITKIIPALEVK